MKLHHMSIMIVLVSVVVLGFVSFISDLGDEYSTTADLTGLNNTQGRMQTQMNTSQEIMNTINDMQLTSVGEAFELPYEMIKVGWLSAKSMFGSWITVEVMASEVAKGVSESGIPLPAYLVGALISILLFTLIAIAIYAFFKWKFED